MIKRITLLIILATTLVSAQQAPQAALTTDKSNATVVIAFACEGTACVGKTVDATAGGIILTVATYNPTVTDTPPMFTRAQSAICTNTGAKIWVTSVPSITLVSGKGQPILDGQIFTIYGYNNIVAFHAIRDAAVSSNLLCDYYRQP
jgi:hypothetical protein